MIRGIAAIVAGLLTLVALLAAPIPGPASPSVVLLATPASPDSGQPQLSAPDRGVILSWVERSGPTSTLKFSERTTGGWSAARSVASGTDWFVNWADVPSVIRLANGDLVAHWLQKRGADSNAYHVRRPHP